VNALKEYVHSKYAQRVLVSVVPSALNKHEPILQSCLVEGRVDRDVLDKTIQASGSIRKLLKFFT